MSFGSDNLQAAFPVGVAIPVKLGPLIEKIYVSPKADSYLRDTIELLVEKFELSNAKIVQSNLFAALR